MNRVHRQACGSFDSVNGCRKLLRLLLVTAVSFFTAACHREAAPSFEQSLRCGMTRAEVRRMAHEHGYGSSDQSWLTRAVASQSKKSKDLSLVDLRFHGDRLVGLKVGTYDPRTKRVTYRDVDLCSTTTSGR
jgi:hypothetical protein